MKLYVTRHGETEWNHLNKVLGRTDIHLNEKGHQQAEKLAEDLKNVHIDKIYSSPLSRAVQTATPVSKDKNLEIIKDDRLIEQNFGIFEGFPRDDEHYQEEKYQFFKPFENGESFLDVSARIYPFIEEMIKNEDENASVLIVTHGGICRIIANYFEGMNNQDFPAFFMKNCQLLEFNTKNGRK